MTSAIGVILALVAGLAVLLSRRGAIRQTTLVGAWWWTLAALLAWSGVELWSVISGDGSGRFPPLRFAAIALSFCPVVAVLGAKRPQHKAWNLVVLALWGIVALPAAENFLLRRGQHVEIGDIRGWFLWVLIMLGPINFVPTRYWLAALILCVGQVIALGPHLALIRRPLIVQPELVGFFIAAAALVVAWLVSCRRTVASNGYDRAWIDFRDSFGLLWSLRVQERVNAAARQSNWDLELTWTGFHQRTTDAPLTEIEPAIESNLRTTFKGLLRRFVSSEWLGTRL